MGKMLTIEDLACKMLNIQDLACKMMKIQGLTDKMFKIQVVAGKMFKIQDLATSWNWQAITALFYPPYKEFKREFKQRI